jgi:hypothetical protein
MDVPHGHHQRIAGNPGIAGSGLTIGSIADDTDVRRSAADIEGDQMAALAERTTPGPT